MVTRIHKLFKRRPRFVVPLVYSQTWNIMRPQCLVEAHVFLFILPVISFTNLSCLRTQRAGTHAGSNPFKERTLCVPLAPDALCKTLEAMDELDHAEHMPEGMNPLLWEQFCHIRRTKIETEHKVMWAHGYVRELTVKVKRQIHIEHGWECVSGLFYFREACSLRLQESRHVVVHSHTSMSSTGQSGIFNSCWEAGLPGKEESWVWRGEGGRQKSLRCTRKVGRCQTPANSIS